MTDNTFDRTAHDDVEVHIPESMEDKVTVHDYRDETLGEKVADKADDARDFLADKADDAKDFVEDKADDAHDFMADKADDTHDFVEDRVDDVRDDDVVDGRHFADDHIADDVMDHEGRHLVDHDGNGVAGDSFVDKVYSSEEHDGSFLEKAGEKFVEAGESVANLFKGDKH